MLWNPQRGEVTTTTVDDFERTNFGDFYTAATSEWDTVESSNLSFTPPSGNRVARNIPGSGFSRVVSTSGLPNYFPKGEVGRCHVRCSGTGAGLRVMFGASTFNNYYYAQVNWDVENVQIAKVVDGTNTVLATDTGVVPSANTDCWFDITRDDGTMGGSDNDISVEYYEGGSLITTLSTNDSTHATAEGVGFVGLSSTSGSTLYADHYHLRSGN